MPAPTTATESLRLAIAISLGMPALSITVVPLLDVVGEPLAHLGRCARLRDDADLGVGRLDSGVARISRTALFMMSMTSFGVSGGTAMPFHDDHLVAFDAGLVDRRNAGQQRRGLRPRARQNAQLAVGDLPRRRRRKVDHQLHVVAQQRDRRGRATSCTATSWTLSPLIALNSSPPSACVLPAAMVPTLSLPGLSLARLEKIAERLVFGLCIRPRRPGRRCRPWRSWRSP